MPETTETKCLKAWFVVLTVSIPRMKDDSRPSADKRNRG
jgi:hypothetical protein